MPIACSRLVEGAKARAWLTKQTAAFAVPMYYMQDLSCRCQVLWVQVGCVRRQAAQSAVIFLCALHATKQCAKP